MKIRISRKIQRIDFYDIDISKKNIQNIKEILKREGLIDIAEQLDSSDSLQKLLKEDSLSVEKIFDALLSSKDYDTDYLPEEIFSYEILT